MKHRIFICYRRRETTTLAGRLYDIINTWFPENVFIDLEKILPGNDFRKHIKSAMSDCRVVVALIGPEWATELNSPRRKEEDSDYVRSELEQAIAAGLTVIPILLDGAPMPTLSDLPPSVQALQFQQSLEVRTSCFAHDILPLRTAICKACGLEPPTLFEEFVSRSPGMKTVDERTRDTCARVALYFAVYGGLGLLNRLTYSLAFVCFCISIWSAIVGVNSRRFKVLAYASALAGIPGAIVSFWFFLSCI